MKFAKLLPLAAVLLTLGVATARAAEPGAAQKHFLWKVSGGKGVVYVLGTIHAAKPTFYPLAPIIESAFRRSDTLIEEIDLTKASEAQSASKDILQRGLYANGDSIANHLSEETRERLAAYMKTSPLRANYTHLKPWLISLMILQQEFARLGLDKSKGLDMHFLQEATTQHKPIGALESADFQLKMFSSFSDELQDQLLLATLLDTDGAAAVLDRTIEAWSTGNADALEQVMTREMRKYPSLEPVMDKLFYERNDAMSRQIGQFLQTPKTYFVAVGAGHLVGRRGILQQLGKTYRVEQR